MRIFKVTETLQKVYFVCIQDEQNVNHVLANTGDWLMDPEPIFLKVEKKELTQVEIDDCSEHQGTDEYILWDTLGVERQWSDFT